MRSAFLGAAGLLSAANGLLLREEPGEDMDFLTPPEGIAFTGNPASVVCEEEVDISKKEILATIMACDVAGTPASRDETSICQPFMKGGCDNEVCHKFCHKHYVSHNEYMSCKCAHWGDAKQFKEYSKGAPCPLKVQPRCFGGNLYRSQCEAQHANPDVSIDEFVSASDKEWPEGDMSAMIPSHATCGP